MNSNLFKTLRMICSIIAAVILAACVFVFVYAGWAWGLGSLALAGIFAVLTFIFKDKQESLEKKDKPAERTRGDFITGPLSDDENK